MGEWTGQKQTHPHGFFPGNEVRVERINGLKGEKGGRRDGQTKGRKEGLRGEGKGLIEGQNN